MVEMFAALKSDLIPASQSLRWLAHVHLGLAIYLMAAGLSARGLRSPVAIILVVVAEILNEIMDLSRFWPDIPFWIWADSGNDMLHTLFWPSILFFGAHWRHWGRQSRQSADAPPSEAGEAASTSGEAPLS